MKNISKMILFSISLVFLPSSVIARGRCKVTDPTGTHLNIRDRQKNIIGSVHNGVIVHILEDGVDDNGKPWALIASQSGKHGWVYREFLSCY